MTGMFSWHTMIFPMYRIFPAIRRGFRPSRMTSNNLISPMKFCYNTNSTLPKQCQSSRSVLKDGSRTFGLFWKEKNPSYNRRNTVIVIVIETELRTKPRNTKVVLGSKHDCSELRIKPRRFTSWSMSLTFLQHSASVSPIKNESSILGMFV